MSGQSLTRNTVEVSPSYSTRHLWTVWSAVTDNARWLIEFASAAISFAFPARQLACSAARFDSTAIRLASSAEPFACSESLLPWRAWNKATHPETPPTNPVMAPTTPVIALMSIDSTDGGER